MPHGQTASMSALRSARCLRSLLTQGVASGPELTASVPTLVLALPVVVAACRVAAVVNLPAAASAHAPQTSGPTRTHAGRCPPPAPSAPVRPCARAEAPHCCQEHATPPHPSAAPCRVWSQRRGATLPRHSVERCPAEHGRGAVREGAARILSIKVARGRVVIRWPAALLPALSRPAPRPAPRPSHTYYDTPRL